MLIVSPLQRFPLLAASTVKMNFSGLTKEKKQQQNHESLLLIIFTQLQGHSPIKVGGWTVSQVSYKGCSYR